MVEHNPQGAKKTMETKDTGTHGVLYLQDSGSYIVLGFWCKDPNFTARGLRFSWESPLTKGSIGNVTLTAGGGLKPIQSFSAPLSGTIKWYIHPTGTSELGGPTELKKNISRSESKPWPPDILALYMTGTNRAYFKWNVRESGGVGLRVTRFDVGYGTNPTKPTTLIKNASPAQDYQGSRTITGLSTDTIYYFFARVANKKGVSDWSEPWGILTSGGVMVKHQNQWRNAVPYVFVNGQWRRALAYHKKNGSWQKTR